MYVMGDEATLMACHANVQEGSQLVTGAVGAAGRCGAASLRITVGSNYPGVGPAVGELTARAAAVVGTADILALDFTTVAPGGVLAPAYVDVVEARTYEDVAQFERTSALGWGYPPPSEESIRSAYERLAPGWFLAYRNGIPSGTAGFALVANVARFWGASVVPGMRSRGVYRSLVAYRLVSAASRGATLALVHAEPSSSPILQRLGFRKFGERHTFRVEL